jgi:hypothetical protein
MEVTVSNTSNCQVRDTDENRRFDSTRRIKYRRALAVDVRERGDEKKLLVVSNTDGLVVDVVRLDE